MIDPYDSPIIKILSVNMDHPFFQSLSKANSLNGKHVTSGQAEVENTQALS